MVRWHCPADTGFEIRALAVRGRARYLSVTEALHKTEFYEWMGKKPFCFFQTTETGDRTRNSSVKGSGANHYPRAPAHRVINELINNRVINEFEVINKDADAMDVVVFDHEFKKWTRHNGDCNNLVIQLYKHTSDISRPTMQAGLGLTDELK